MSYDPAVGRWTSEDPIAFEGGDANLYRYVGNAPTNYSDRLGLYQDGPIMGMTPEHDIPARPGPSHNLPPGIPSSVESVLLEIIPIIEKTRIWEFAPESCQRWILAFEDNLHGFSNSNVKERNVGWEPSNAIGGGHAFYYFELTDGSIIKVDHWVFYGGTRIKVVLSSTCK